MRNLGSYHLVSKHSILSARREKRDTASAPRTHSQRLEAFGEWVRQIGTTRESYRCHDSNTTAPDFKVYDRGRGKIEGSNSRRQIREDEKETKRRPHAEIESEHLIPGAQRDTARKKMEVSTESLENRLDAVELRVDRIMKSLEELKAMMAELRDLESETEESEKEEGIEGSSGVPSNVIAKPEVTKEEEGGKSETEHDMSDDGRRDEIGGNLEPANQQSTMESQREEDFPEVSSSQATHSGETMTAASPSNDLGKICLSHETEESGGEEEAPVEELMPEGSPATATATDGGVPMAEEWPVSGESFLSLTAEMCDSERKEKKKISAEGLAGKVDHVDISLGQAQVTVSKSAQTLLFTPTQFIINEEVLQVKRQVNHVAISLGQTHNFIITPSIFTNTGGVLQAEKEMDQKKRKLNGYDWAQNPDLNFKASASVFWFVGTPKIEVNFSAAFVSFSNNREATILYYLLKNRADWRAFDPGGSLSVSGIMWSLCFKLWDPGGRLIVCFSISSP